MVLLSLTTQFITIENSINHALFDKDKAGFFVWTVMHLYSAYVPEIPTVEE